MPGALPDWYTPEQPIVAQAAPAANKPLPSWYTPEPAATANTQAHPLLDDANDVAANIATGILKVPGAIGGVPNMIGHTANWAKAQLFNALDAVTGGKGGHTGAEQDANDPVMQVLPSSQAIDSFIEKPPLPDFMTRAVNGSGPGKFYQPESVGGRLLQAGVTGAASGGASIPSAIKTGLAAMGAEGTNELFPGNPGLAALVALATHAGAGLTGRGASAAYDATLPLTRPKVAAAKVAGRALANVDNTQPGMAAPSSLDLSNAEANTAIATGDIPHGLDNYDAGGAIREGLQGRADKLTAARGAAADAAYDKFRDEQPLEGAKLAPFMASPSFRSAVKDASNGSLDRLQAPLTSFLDFNAAGDPVFRPNAAVPPDVLQRIKGALDDQIASPSTGNVRRGDLTDLRTKFVGLLDKEYASTYPQTRAEFAANSRPLDPLAQGANAKTLNSSTSFGNRTYTVPQDKVVGAYLQSGSPSRASFQNLIDGFGGDRKVALKALEDNLANKVQGAVKGDGTLSLDAFNRAIKPYAPALNMWFPELAQKFKTAEASQKSLETLRGQDTLAQDVREGGLRSPEGLITPSSAQAWLTKNAKELDKTQAPGAVIRMKQIAAALPHAPTAVGEAVLEGAPAAVGFGLGGAESGIFGTMFHAIPKALAGPSFDKFRAAYSDAIEKAFSDPMYAQRLSKGINMRPNGMTTTQALGNAVAEDLKKGLLATPTATIAGGAKQ